MTSDPPHVPCVYVRSCGACCDVCARDVKPPEWHHQVPASGDAAGGSRAVAHSKQMRWFTSAGAAASHAAPQSVDNTTSDAQRMMMIYAAVKVCRLQHITCAHAYSPAPSRGSSSKCTCQIVTKTDGATLHTRTWPGTCAGRRRPRSVST